MVCFMIFKGHKVWRPISIRERKYRIVSGEMLHHHLSLSPPPESEHEEGADATAGGFVGSGRRWQWQRQPEYLPRGSSGAGHGEPGEAPGPQWCPLPRHFKVITVVMVWVSSSSFILFFLFFVFFFVAVSAYGCLVLCFCLVSSLHYFLSVPFLHITLPMLKRASCVRKL